MPISTERLKELRSGCLRAMDHDEQNDVARAIDELLDRRGEDRWIPVSERADCFICKQSTNSLAADPSKWPLRLGFVGGNGATRVYHQGCVVEVVARITAFQLPEDTQDDSSKQVKE